MSRQFWTETLTWATSSGTAVSGTTSETILFPNVTIPANYLQDGRSLWTVAIGQYTTSATPTITFSQRWGGVAGTLICKSGAITGQSGGTACIWGLETYITTRSNGSTGTVMGNGWAFLGSQTAPTVGSATASGAIGPMSAGGQTVPAVATLDLTADTAFSTTITWSSNTAANTATGLNYYIVALN